MFHGLSDRRYGEKLAGMDDGGDDFYGGEILLSNPQSNRYHPIHSPGENWAN